MIDKKTEGDIKTVKGFLEFWMKFHSMYSEIISKDIITPEDEAKYIEAKSAIKAKYDGLKSGLEFKYMPHSRLTDPVSDILSLDSIRFISEKNLRKLENDWKDSYIFLNNIEERLKSKRRRLEQFNPVGVFFKRMWERK